jgi:formylglycine-generating enzyme required for sulfatase activity
MSCKPKTAICGTAFVVAALWLCSGTFAAAPAQDAIRSFTDCAHCPEMIVVPPGTFLMGSSAADTDRDIQSVPLIEKIFAKNRIKTEYPQHAVKIVRSFALAKYPVTRDEFDAFIRATNYRPQGGCTLFIPSNHHYANRDDAAWDRPGFDQMGREPVVCVSWQDANAYISWLNNGKVNGADAGLEGPYRLPSEAEWEYAARAGTQTARWWGNAIGANNADCDGCGSPWDKSKTAPVDRFASNPFGLADMLGNVWQLTQDCWHESYVDASADGDAWIEGECNARVMRGGSWTNEGWILRSSNRTRTPADFHGNYIGFRVAKTLR